MKRLLLVPVFITSALNAQPEIHIPTLDEYIEQGMKSEEMIDQKKEMSIDDLEKKASEFEMQIKSLRRRIHVAVGSRTGLLTLPLLGKYFFTVNSINEIFAREVFSDKLGFAVTGAMGMAIMTGMYDFVNGETVENFDYLKYELQNLRAQVEEFKIVVDNKEFVTDKAIVHFFPDTLIAEIEKQIERCDSYIKSAKNFEERSLLSKIFLS